MNQHAAEWDNLSQRQRNSSDKWHERREQIMRAESDWWTNQENVKRLGDELEQHGYLPREFRRDYEAKPFRWNCEWRYLEKNGTMEGFNGEVFI